MGYNSRKAELSKEEAEKLLGKYREGVSVNGMEQIAFTNDVFRVKTESHGNYYVKFYTARWYDQSGDQTGNVEQELAAYTILKSRGFSLPYEMWGDCSHSIVDESILICSELPGTPIPSVLEMHPEDEMEIWETLGRYLRGVHDIRFTNPVALGREHQRIAESPGVYPYTTNPGCPDDSPKRFAEKRQNQALSDLENAAANGYLDETSTKLLKDFFSGIAKTVEPEYAEPCFTVLNVHDHHFHLDFQDRKWEILGFYDFEHASACDPHIDLVDLEMTVTPNINSYQWREAFFRGYGEIRNFHSLKMNLLYYLVGFLGDPRGKMIPDQDWLFLQWPALVNATSIQELIWFPADD